MPYNNKITSPIISTKTEDGVKRNMVTKEQIIDFIVSTNEKWSTPSEIASRTKSAREEVVQILLSNDDFVQSEINKSGEARFTTRERYKKQTSVIQKIIAAATNRITD